MNLGSALIRKSLFGQLGPLNTQLFYCDDWDWFMRAREMGIRMHVHSGLVLYYRRHEGNLTNNRKLDNHFILQMLKNSDAGELPAGGLRDLFRGCRKKYAIKNSRSETH
jgi:GT2 family glycosyltransferase